MEKPEIKNEEIARIYDKYVAKVETAASIISATASEFKGRVVDQMKDRTVTFDSIAAVRKDILKAYAESFLASIRQCEAQYQLCVEAYKEVDMLDDMGAKAFLLTLHNRHLNALYQLEEDMTKKLEGYCTKFVELCEEIEKVQTSK